MDNWKHLDENKYLNKTSGSMNKHNIRKISD